MLYCNCDVKKISLQGFRQNSDFEKYFKSSSIQTEIDLEESDSFLMNVIFWECVFGV